MSDVFLQFLVKRYGSVKAQFPGEGRRRWRLRVLQDFLNLGSSWASIPAAAPDTTLSQDESLQDSDPFDHLSQGEELGLLLRTDFSNEDAWQAFYTKLQDSEEEFAESLEPEIKDDFSSGQDVITDVNVAEGEPESDSDESMSGVSTPLIKVVNPITTQDRIVFNNMSNLSALRLLNDVDIRPSPNPPPGTPRISPPNRLIDQAGWQEVYSGKNIWIYDALSNSDQSVRLVSQHGDIYGTATGDSWRARGTHICDLQFNISSLGMMINFGGLDRWDHNERQRNLVEANEVIL